MRRCLALGSILLAPLAASAAESIELVNGDELNGTVLERTDEHVVLEHPVLGRIEIPVDRIKPPEPPNEGLFGTSFLAGWKRTFQVGASGARGNSRTADVLAALDMDYADDDKRWAFDAAYRFGAADGDTTEHDAFTQLRRDWLFEESRWFVFGIGRFDYDQFKNWEYRVNGSGGVGYKFWSTEEFELEGLVGPSLTKQWRESDFFVEALVGLEAVWNISKDHSLAFSNKFFPALNDLGEFRNLSTLAYRWKLLEDPGLSLIAGVDNEYQSSVQSDVKHNDLKYSTSIGIDF